MSRAGTLGKGIKPKDIASKGSITFGISSVVTRLCKVVLLNVEEETTVVSHWRPDLDCCLSLPALVGRPGIVKMSQVPLAEAELTQLRDSATSLRRESLLHTDPIDLLYHKPFNMFHSSRSCNSEHERYCIHVWK